MNIFRFLDWEMYKDAKKLNQKIGRLAIHFPLEIKKKYSSQMNRAALSVCLNIAEAAGRYSDIEMCRFFDYSLGSISEVIACIDNLKDENLIDPSQSDEIYDDAFHVAKQIQGMQNNARKNPRTYSLNK